MRNLRNILEQAPEAINEALETLTNEVLIKKSLVLPFQYLTAYEEIAKMPPSALLRGVFIALNKAIDITLNNIPVFYGETLVVLDVSGSMEGMQAKIGALFASALIKSNNSDFMVFADDAHYLNINTMDTTITIASSIRFSGGGTNFHSIFLKANKKYDRIIILSDMQGWIGRSSPMNTFNKYKMAFGANPFVYSFDLNGYGSMQFPENNVICIAGFSEKIFDIMKLVEDKNGLVDEIGNIKIY